MEQSWSIDGSYARWNLTVTVVPTDAEPLRECDFESVAAHFVDAVNRYELGREIDRLGSSQLWRLM